MISCQIGISREQTVCGIQYGVYLNNAFIQFCKTFIEVNKVVTSYKMSGYFPTVVLISDFAEFA